VTVLAPVRAVGDKGRGCQVSLSCSRCQEYGSCHKKEEPAVRLSSTHPTELACLQELLGRLQDRHVDCVGNQTGSLILPCTKETLKAKFNDKHPNLLSSSQYDEVLAEEVWNLKQAYRETCLCRTCFNCRLYREAMGVVSQIIALLFKPSARQDADDACPDEEPCITNLLRLHDF